MAQDAGRLLAKQEVAEVEFKGEGHGGTPTSMPCDIYAMHNYTVIVHCVTYWR
jgi:hypothetical protein